MHIKVNKKYLSYNEYKAKCALGKRGIGYKKREGDLIIQKVNIGLSIYCIEEIE